MCWREEERRTLRRVRMIIDCDLRVSVDRELAGTPTN